MRMRRAWAGLVVLLVLGASCSGDGADDANGPRLVPLGTVALVRGDETVSVSEPLTLVTGDVVRSGMDGGARVEWQDGRSVELAPETHLVFGTPIPELVRGSVLIEGAEALTLTAGAAQIEGFGAFRIDRELYLRVGVYEGTAAFPGSGWDGELGALSEASVNALAGAIAEGPQPLEVSPTDPWDARFLGPAIDVGLRIADLQRGLAAQVRNAQGAVLSVLAEDFPRASLARLLQSVAPAELVVAAQAALLAAEINDLPASAVLREILAFRADGASWPLVVAQWGLERAALLAAVARAAQAIAGELRPPVRSGPGGGVAPGAGPGGGTSPSPGDTGGTPRPGDGSQPPPVQPPNDDPTPPDPPDPPACNGTVDCLVDDVIDVAEDTLPGP